MKTILPARYFLLLATIVLIIQSCKKETTHATTVVALSQDNSTAKIKRLVLQPGPTDGMDTWLTWQRGDDVLPNTNWDTVILQPLMHGRTGAHLSGAAHS